MERPERRDESTSNRVKRYEGNNVFMELENYYYLISHPKQFPDTFGRKARST